MRNIFWLCFMDERITGDCHVARKLASRNDKYFLDSQTRE